jgi:hypothetical protein
MPGRKFWMMVGCFLAMSACSGDDNDRDLQGMLGELEQAESLFSFLFTSQEPNGLGLAMVAHSLAVDDPCLFLASEGEAATGPASFSIMRLELNHASTGPFEVIWEEPPDGFHQDPRNLAMVGVMTVEDWKGGSLVQATSGTLDVTECPGSVPDWNEGTTLSGEVVVNFPVHSSRSVECSVTQGTDFYKKSCICEDEQGNRSECESQTPGEDCCKSASDESIGFQLTFQSERCKELCAVAVADGPHPTGYSCGDLQ